MPAFGQQKRHRSVALLGDRHTHEIRRFSAANYNDMARVRLTNQWLQERKQQQGIVAIESGLPSCKTARLDRYNARVRALLIHLPTLLTFYNIDHQAKRFSLYRGKQKANAEMVNIFTNGGHNVILVSIESSFFTDAKLKEARSHSFVIHKVIIAI